MLESGSSGSVRGVLSNEHPYREPGSNPEVAAGSCHFRFALNNGHLSPRSSGPQCADFVAEIGIPTSRDGWCIF